ncbi:MAG TPA: RHS repeat-associated core domain-containing protein, partial [Chloroflexota bacterium]
NGSTTHQWQYSYNAGGQQTVTLDAVGNVSSTTYYADGLVQSNSDGAGDVTSYGYDAVGNATTVMSPDANAAGSSSPANTPTYNFYTWDNLLAESMVPVASADGVMQRSTCYYFDAAGRKTSEGDLTNTGSMRSTGECPGSPPAQSLAFAYFPTDRLQSETGRDGSSARDFAYDAAGNQVAAVTSSVWVSPTYYADGLLRTVNDGENRTQSYAWDGAGQMTGRNTSGTGLTSFLTTMTYNDAELPASESGFIAPGTPSTWTYDAGGRPLQENDNGTVISYTYAADGSLSQMGQTWSPHINVVDGDYRVTEDGCETCEDSGNSGVGYIWNYQYDAAGRMTAMQSLGAGPWQYARYDPSGNRLSHTDALSGATTTYAYNLDDTIATATPVGSTALAATYTTQGLLSTDGCIQYTPDAFDRTQQVAAQSGAPPACGAAPATTTYSYDALDRQVQSVKGSTTTTVHYDGLSSRELVESTSGVDTGYQLTAAGTAMGVDKTSPSTLEFLSSDTKGSVSTTMSASGAPGCQIQYDPFGQVVSSNSNVCETDVGGHQPTTNSDVLYRNLHRDSTTGSYQMGARTYDPTKNAFLEPDHYQLGQPGQDVGLATDPLTRNARVYVDGDPVNHIDPTGHSYTTGNDSVDNQGSSVNGGCQICFQTPVSGTCTACGNTTGTQGWHDTVGGNGSGSGSGAAGAGRSSGGGAGGPSGGATPFAGCHSDACIAGQDVRAELAALGAQVDLFFACQSGVRAACHGLNDEATGYEQYLGDLGSQLNTELTADAAANAAAAQARATAARTCDNFLCGATQALWGTFEGLGSITNPGSRHLVDAWLQPRDNPWLAGDCSGMCL